MHVSSSIKINHHRDVETFNECHMQIIVEKQTWSKENLTRFQLKIFSEGTTVFQGETLKTLPKLKRWVSEWVNSRNELGLLRISTLQIYILVFAMESKTFLHF